MSGPAAATQLLAVARGKPDHAGPHRCFLCGGACRGVYARQQQVADTFTAINTVACPASDVVCRGCVLAMRVEHVPDPTKPKGTRMVKPWQAQWVITATAATSMSFDLPRLTAVCLSPPDGEWAVALSSTLKKHLLYRTPVNLGSGGCVVRLDDELISYRPASLAHAIDTVTRIVAGVGKLSVREGPTAANLALRLVRCRVWPAMAAVSLVEEWCCLAESPLGRLAAFLCPSREVCREQLGLRD